MTRPHVIGCGALGGRNPKTGQPVGERHRWGGGKWGEGRCDFCGHYLEGVLAKPKREVSLEQAIARDQAAAGYESNWLPSYWDGSQNIAKGWYIKRPQTGGGIEWLMATKDKALRCDTEAQARDAIAATLAATTK